MNKLLILFMFSIFSLAANAQVRYGSQCGLIDDADLFVLKSSDSQKWSMKTELSDLQKIQIQQMDDETAGMSPEEALSYLIDGSSTGEVRYISGMFQGKEFQMIEYYPGDNRVAVVFAKDTEKALAWIEDSDLICAP